MFSEEPANIELLSTYPPRECRLEIFTHDTAMHLNYIKSACKTKIADARNESLQQNDKIVMEFMQNNENSSFQITIQLNHSDIEILMIESENPYGGKWRESPLDMRSI